MMRSDLVFLVMVSEDLIRFTQSRIPTDLLYRLQQLTHTFNVVIAFSDQLSTKLSLDQQNQSDIQALT